MNYVYNLCNIWGVRLAKTQYINDAFKQFYCSCSYVPTANNKGMYIKLLTEDDSEGASKCR